PPAAGGECTTPCAWTTTPIQSRSSGASGRWSSSTPSRSKPNTAPRRSGSSAGSSIEEDRHEAPRDSVFDRAGRAGDGRSRRGQDVPLGERSGHRHVLGPAPSSPAGRRRARGADNRGPRDLGYQEGAGGG